LAETATGVNEARPGLHHGKEPRRSCTDAMPDFRPPRAAKIASPCLGVCVIDARIAACYGCFRTLAEIAAWPSANAAEQRAILEAMAERRLKAMPRKE